MQLLIPKEEAINILNQRRKELTAPDFNSKVWKDRTLLDINQIFGTLTDQSLQISSIHFDTVVSSQKAQILREGKEAAFGLLNSYINFEKMQVKINNQTDTILLLKQTIKIRSDSILQLNKLKSFKQ